MDKHETVKTVNDIERQQYRYQLLIRSLEAKIERVEPGSVEFENTVAAIFDAQNKIWELSVKRMNLVSDELATRSE